MFQHYAVFKHMTVAKNVAFGLEIRKRPKAEVADAGRRAARARAPLAVRAPAARRSSPAASASGWRWPGRSPSSRSVLLLDEPFGALDAKVRKELRDWLRRLHDEVHVTTVFVTHDQEEALEVADEIVVINEGRVEQIGTPDAALRRAGQRLRDGLPRRGDPAQRRSACGPHDIEVSTAPAGRGGAVAGAVTRMLRVGFEVRLTVLTDDGDEVVVMLTRTHARALGLDTTARCG